MGFLEDMMGNIGNGFNAIGQANQGLSHAITSSLGNFGQKLDAGMTGMNGTSPSDPYSSYGMGSADSSAPSAPPMQNAGSMMPTGDPADRGLAAIQGQDTTPPAQPGLSQTMIDAFTHMLNTPAIDPNIINQTFAQMNGIQHPNYLQLAQDAYAKDLGSINQGMNQVHGQYNQVGTDMKDMYNTNANVSRLGNNNILQQVANNEGNAVQGGARANVAALAQLKNAELAQRAAVAQRGGMPMAAGDQKTDPADVAVAGTLQNAQQQAENAQAAATQGTNLNNEMATAIGTQGIAANTQLQNQRTSYDESMNKYKADLANQEATREMEAQKQNYADAMARIQAGYGMAKDSAQANTDRFAALVGNKGLMSALSDVGTYNLDQGKALQAQAAAGTANVDPASTALHSYPQFATAYNNALMGQLQVTPGTKPTYADIVKAMSQDPSIKGNPNINGNDLINFAQMATANKAQADPNIDMLLAMQNGG